MAVEESLGLDLVLGLVSVEVSPVCYRCWLILLLYLNKAIVKMEELLIWLLVVSYG